MKILTDLNYGWQKYHSLYESSDSNLKSAPRSITFLFWDIASYAISSLKPWGRAVNIISDFFITSLLSSHIKVVLLKKLLYIELDI